jgi:hypothetical protein
MKQRIRSGEETLSSEMYPNDGGVFHADLIGCLNEVIVERRDEEMFQCVCGSCIIEAVSIYRGNRDRSIREGECRR